MSHIQHWESTDFCLSKQIMESGDESTFVRFGSKGMLSIQDLDTINYVQGSSKYLTNKSFRIGWAENDIDGALDKILMTMHPGEKAAIKARIQRTIEDFVLIECVVKVDDEVVVSDPVYKWQPEVKFAAAQELADLGSSVFKAGHFQDSFVLFRNALNLTVFVIEGENYDSKSGALMDGQRKPSVPTAGVLQDKSLLEEVLKMRTKCRSNLALMQMKMGNFSHVVSLTKDAMDAKSCYRRGVAQAELGEFDDAIDAFEKVLIMEPLNKAASLKLQETKAKKLKAEIELSKGLQKMFA